MTKNKKSILLFVTMGVLLISGCGAKEEVQFETLSQSEKSAKTESVSEPEAGNEQESSKVENNSESEPKNEQELAKVQSTSETELGNEQESVKAESASETEPGNEQETKTTQITSDKEVKYIDISHIFKPYEQTVEISLRIPEDWKYTIWDVENESPDWGFSINVSEKDDANFHIFGQFGTLTAADYSNGPESFQTSQGLTGQYFWDEYMLDDGNLAIQGMAIFDTELTGFYGASFNMPKSIYSENKNIIDEMFQSIVIRGAQ